MKRVLDFTEKKLIKNQKKIYFSQERENPINIALSFLQRQRIVLNC